jgi:hypothetical protein
MTKESNETERLISQRHQVNEGMNVSPPAPSNMRPPVPPPAPPKAPSK